MNLLPKSSGNRPRLACEIFAGGVVAAQSAEPGGPVRAVARAQLAEAAIVPSLKPGNVADRLAVIAALRRVLEQVGGRPNARNADVTLVIPDPAVRVLLLDFDTLPNKLSDALPIVRFRLRKLLPFDADQAMVSFQVMSTSRALVRVLAVAIPRDVLSEYESMAREAGFEPGAVLPSTLASLAALDESEGASLVVNASSAGVTTAIVRAGIILLHRAVDLADFTAPVPASLPPALFEPTAAVSAADRGRAFTENGSAAGGWNAQTSAPDHGRDLQSRYVDEPAPLTQFPYLGPTSSADLDATQHNAILVAPTSVGTLTDPAASDLDQLQRLAVQDDLRVPVHTLAPDAQAEEIARAVSVAAAYFEDSLGAAPQVMLAAGALGSDALNRMLREQRVLEDDGLRARELVEPGALAPDAVSAAVPRSWLAGVVGALKS